MSDDDLKPEEAAAETPASEENAPAAEAETPAEAAPAAEAETPAPEAAAAKAEAPTEDGTAKDGESTDGEKKDGKEGEGEPKDGEAAEGEKKDGEEGEGEEGEKKEERPKVRLVKGAKNIGSGIVHIKATFNNTIVSITDVQGNVVSWSTAGRAGFKGSRKSTAYAASVVAQDAARAAMGHGMQEAEVRVQGPGAGRESAIRAIQSAGISVSAIRDVTPIPHNGCRPRKRRRV